MNAHTAASLDLDLLLGQVATEFFERLSRGEAPQVDEYVQRHPEIAEMIRHALPALQMVSDSIADASSSAPSLGEKHEKRLGDFHILHELGRGGMGIVYEAEQISMGRRKVALKVLPFAAMVDEKRLQRFRNEIRAAASLDHPNIVSVYSVGEERGVHFYAMQLIRGQNLAALINQLRELRQQQNPLSGSSLKDVLSASVSIPPASGGTEPTEDHFAPKSSDSKLDAHVGPRAPNSDTVPEAQGLIRTKGSPRRSEFFHSVTELGIQAADALEHAHQQGVIHRDIKPANLMVDANAKLYITDFGLAQMEDDVGITMTGDIVGTLRYMSPEQALGKRVTIDHRADIYALGVSLYELLTTEPAFDGENRAALLKQIAFQELRRLRQIDRTIPHDLETIIHKAVTKNPDERYFSAQELANDLKSFRDNQPISARPPSIVDRSRKWVFRNQGLVLATAVVMLITTIGLAISNSLIASQRNAAQTAREAAEVAVEGEKKQREEAEKQAEIAMAISKFLQEDLLEYATPERNPSHAKLTVDELVDRAALKLDDKFAQQPHIRERLRLTIAGIYQHMGQFNKAEPLIEQALEFQRAVAGDDDTVTREYMNSLAITYLQQGKHNDRSESLLKSNLDYIKQSGRSESNFAIATLRNLALVRQKQQRYPEAIALFEQVMDTSRRVLGEENEMTISNAAEFARLLERQGKYSESAALLEATIESMKRVLGETNRMTLDWVGKLADVYVSLSEFGKAENLLTECVETQRRVYGEENEGTLRTMTSLASLYLRQSKYELAQSMFQEIIAKGREAFSEENPLVVEAKFQLARTYLSHDMLDEAEPMFLESLNTFTRQVGKDHGATLSCMNSIGQMYIAGGEYEKAKTFLEPALAAKRRLLGDDHPDIPMFMSDLANVYIKTGQVELAKSLCIEVVDRSRQTLGAEHSNTLLNMARLARIYHVVGEPNKALPLFQESLESQRKVLGEEHAWTIRTKQNLGRLYLDQGEFDKAEPLLVVALESRRSVLGNEHSDTLTSMDEMAQLMFKQNKHVEAETLFRECLALREVKHPDRWMTFRTQSLLGTALVGQKKFAEAEPYIIDGCAGLKRREDKIPYDERSTLPDSIQRAVDLYTEWDRPVEAQKWQKRLPPPTQPAE